MSLEETAARLLESHGMVFDPCIHIGAPPASEDALAAASELRAAVESLAAATGSAEQHPPWSAAALASVLEPANLQRILRARKFDMPKALQLAAKTVTWRTEYCPEGIEPEELRVESCTGKTRMGERLDRFGRPVVVLDSSAQNTKKPEGHVRLLAWTMERSMRAMLGRNERQVAASDEVGVEEGGGAVVSPPVVAVPVVEKQALFMHMNKFSLFNAPGLATTRQTIDILASFYCERLGHAILWKPPAYFSTFLLAVKRFVDPVTLSKVVIIKGNTDPGSKNDELLHLLIGKDWRAISGVEGVREAKTSSPGYHHPSYWHRVRNGLHPDGAHFAAAEPLAPLVAPAVGSEGKEECKAVDATAPALTAPARTAPPQSVLEAAAAGAGELEGNMASMALDSSGESAPPPPPSSS